MDWREREKGEASGVSYIEFLFMVVLPYSLTCRSILPGLLSSLSSFSWYFFFIWLPLRLLSLHFVGCWRISGWLQRLLEEIQSSRVARPVENPIHSALSFRPFSFQPTKTTTLNDVLVLHRILRLSTT